jgi:hypothetical protein
LGLDHSKAPPRLGAEGGDEVAGLGHQVHGQRRYAVLLRGAARTAIAAGPTSAYRALWSGACLVHQRDRASVVGVDAATILMPGAVEEGDELNSYPFPFAMCAAATWKRLASPGRMRDLTEIANAILTMAPSVTTPNRVGRNHDGFLRKRSRNPRSSCRSRATASTPIDTNVDSLTRRRHDSTARLGLSAASDTIRP